MCIHPIFMLEKGLEKRTMAIRNADARAGICNYAFEGCEGAKDKEIYKRYCGNNGEFCPRMFDLEMQRQLEEKQ